MRSRFVRAALLALALLATTFLVNQNPPLSSLVLSGYLDGNDRNQKGSISLPEIPEQHYRAMEPQHEGRMSVNNLGASKNSSSSAQDNPSSLLRLQGAGVIEIGTVVDPNEPSPWTQDNNEVLNFGEPADPYLPEASNDSEPTVFNRGEPMDPNAVAPWQGLGPETPTTIGEAMDPDDPISAWSQGSNAKAINIGEPMDPDDPSTWPQ